MRLKIGAGDNLGQGRIKYMLLIGLGQGAVGPKRYGGEEGVDPVAEIG
jgi:hypothetical protein